MSTSNESPRPSARIADHLLDKWQIEERTSLDITTIYRKMKAGTFPQPVRVGRRRVAWRESDVARWQSDLVVGVGKTSIPTGRPPGRRGPGARGENPLETGNSLATMGRRLNETGVLRERT